VDRSCFTKLSLNVILKYFMWEFLPVSAMGKPKLPMYLTLWMDKSSTLCIYTMAQMRIWLVPHLKAGCWYIDCGKIYCPVEEEDVRKACEKADLKGATTSTDNAKKQEKEVEVDLNLSLRRRGTKF
jgi:hypothetical protein